MGSLVKWGFGRWRELQFVGGVGEGEGEGSGHFGAVDVGLCLGHLRESGVEGHLSLDLSLRHCIHLHFDFLEISFEGSFLVIALDGVPLHRFEGLLDGILFLEEFN